MKQLIKNLEKLNSNLNYIKLELCNKIESEIEELNISKSVVSRSMGKSRYYLNQVLWRDTTKPEVIIEIAEAVLKYENR